MALRCVEEGVSFDRLSILSQLRRSKLCSLLLLPTSLHYYHTSTACETLMIIALIASFATAI
jgi:hypothetical protein